MSWALEHLPGEMILEPDTQGSEGWMASKCVVEECSKKRELIARWAKLWRKVCVKQCVSAEAPSPLPTSAPLSSGSAVDFPVLGK